MNNNIEYLQRLGLSPYEAKALVVLLAKKSTTATDISKITAIPVTKVYQVLEKIVDKELATFIPGKPRIYKAKEPDVVLTRLITKHEVHVRTLKSEKRIQIKQLELLEFPDEPTYAHVHPVLATHEA